MDLDFFYLFKVYFYACWTFITPLIIAVVTLLTWIGAEPDQYLDYIFPDWVQAMGKRKPPTLGFSGVESQRVPVRLITRPNGANILTKLF